MSWQVGRVNAQGYGVCSVLVNELAGKMRGERVNAQGDVLECAVCR